MFRGSVDGSKVEKSLVCEETVLACTIAVSKTTEGESYLDVRGMALVFVVVETSKDSSSTSADFCFISETGEVWYCVKKTIQTQVDDNIRRVVLAFTGM